jgi:NADH:ubiquinone oxidoreductase subunit D
MGSKRLGEYRGEFQILKHILILYLYLCPYLPLFLYLSPYLCRSMELAKSSTSMQEKAAEEAENRAKVQAWMAEKRKERQKEYKEQINQLRQKEHSPFVPKAELLRTVSEASVGFCRCYQC